jgi:hypothetical protein
MSWTPLKRKCRLVGTALVLAAAVPERSTAGVGQAVGYRSLLGTAVSSAVLSASPSRPANLLVPSPYHDLVSEMWRRSPAFRRQARRLGEESRLAVRVHAAPCRLRSGPRAVTRVHRLHGSIEADIYIHDAGGFVELLAHEIEHVLEQLDRLDLAAAARRAGGSAWITADGSFETARAIDVGRQVAREVQGFVR